MKQTQNPANISASPAVVPLTSYVNMAPTFGTIVGDLTGKPKCFHRKVGIDMIVDLNNEKDRVTFTVFVVSLKARMAPFWNSQTGVLTLTQDQHYSYLSGMTMVNKDFFNIHKIKRFATGNNGALPGAGTANMGYYPIVMDDQRLRHRFYMKVLIKKQVFNSLGDWKDLAQNPVCARNYFILFFNDNSYLDGENPYLAYNMVHSIQTAV